MHPVRLLMIVDQLQLKFLASASAELVLGGRPIKENDTSTSSLETIKLIDEVAAIQVSATLDSSSPYCTWPMDSSMFCTARIEHPSPRTPVDVEDHTEIKIGVSLISASASRVRR